MKTIMSLTTASVLAISAGTAFAEGSITAVSWGGAYTKSQVEAYHKPWTAATGNTVVSEDYSGGLAEVKAQVDSGSVTWDIIDVEKSDAVRGCDEGLFMEIDHSSHCQMVRMARRLLMTLSLDHSQIARLQTSYGQQFLHMTPLSWRMAQHLSQTSLTLMPSQVSVVYVSHQKQT